MQLSEVVEVTLEVAAILDRLGAPWLVGGSLASSLHGVPRSTQDVDFVADLRPEHVEPLVAEAGEDFYADAAMIRDAIVRRGSFNLLHYGANFKIDVFVAAHEPLARSEMSRRERVRVREEPPGELWVASAEDIILQKLSWFRLGDEVSERQWRDALGVLQVSSDLDFGYLDEWADRVDLTELWTRLRAAAAPGG